MNEQEASQLKVGDIVIWYGSIHDQGKVTEVGYRSFKVEWENGQIGTVDFQGVTPVSLKSEYLKS